MRILVRIKILLTLESSLCSGKEPRRFSQHSQETRLRPPVAMREILLLRQNKEETLFVWDEGFLRGGSTIPAILAHYSCHATGEKAG